MKVIRNICFLSIIQATLIGCNEDESVFPGSKKEIQALCETKNGTLITNQLGRIYKSEYAHFYYIGNPKKVTTGKNGGYVPCDGMPKEFQQEGMLVMYGGIDKGSLSDIGTEDPAIAFITLSQIKKAD